MFGLEKIAANISSGYTLSSLAPVLEALINLASSDVSPESLIPCLRKVLSENTSDTADIRNLRRALVAFARYIEPQQTAPAEEDGGFHDCNSHSVSPNKLLQQQFLAFWLTHILHSDEEDIADKLASIMAENSETDLAKHDQLQIYDTWTITLPRQATSEQLAKIQSLSPAYTETSEDQKKFTIKFITGTRDQKIRDDLAPGDSIRSISRTDQPPPIAKFVYQLIQIKGKAESLQHTDNPYLYNIASFLLASSSPVLHDILMDSSTLLVKGPQIVLALLAETTEGSLSHHDVQKLQAHILSHTDKVEQLTTFILSIMSKDFTEKALKSHPTLPQLTAQGGGERSPQGVSESYVAAFVSSMIDRLSTDLKDKELPALEKLCAFVLMKAGALKIEQTLEFISPLQGNDPRMLVIETLRVISSSEPARALTESTPQSWSHALSNSAQAAITNFIPATKHADSLEQQLLQLGLKSLSPFTYSHSLALVKAIQVKHPDNPLNQRLALANIIMQPFGQATHLPPKPIGTDLSEEENKNYAATVIQRAWRSHITRPNEDPFDTLLSNLLLRADQDLAQAPVDARLRFFAYLLSRYQNVSPKDTRQLLNTFRSHEGADEYANATQIKILISAMLSKKPKEFVAQIIAKDPAKKHIEQIIKPEEATNTLIMHMVSTIFDYTADAPTLTQQCIQIVLNTSNVPKETINGFCKAIEASPAKDQRIALLAVITSPTPIDACQRFIDIHRRNRAAKVIQRIWRQWLSRSSTSTPPSRSTTPTNNGLTTKDITRELVKSGILAGFPDAQYEDIETQLHFMVIKTLLPEEEQPKASEVIAKLDQFDQKTKRIALLTILTANNSVAACDAYLKHDNLTPNAINTILIKSGILAGFPDAQYEDIETQIHFMVIKTLLPEEAQPKASDVIEKLKGFDPKTKRIALLTILTANNSVAACEAFLGEEELTPTKVNTILLNSALAAGMPETSKLSLFQKGLYTLTQALGIAEQKQATKLLSSIEKLDGKTQAIIVARCALSEDPVSFVENLQKSSPCAKSTDQQEQKEFFREHLRGIMGDLSNDPLKEQMSQTVTTLTIILMALYICLSIIAGTHMFFGLGIAATQVGIYVGCSTAAALILQFITYKLIQYQYRITQKIHKPANITSVDPRLARTASPQEPEGSTPRQERRLR